MSERMSLDLADPASGKRRWIAIVVVALLLGGAAGGLVGLIFGRVPGLITVGAIVFVLCLMAWGTSRRTLWLEGRSVGVRTFGTKTVDLVHAERMELMLTDLRGARTVGLLVSGPPKGKTINVALAAYSGTGGRELNILLLRKLADALASSENTSGLVFSQLLVAQLRAEAQGMAAADRPLYQLASLATPGRVAQRLRLDAVTRFVASLD